MPVRLDLHLPAPLASFVDPCDPCIAKAAGSWRGPSEQVPVVLVDRDDRRYATCARWGWRRAQGYLSIHAPVETAPVHPLWRDACGAQRTVAPVGGWWDADGWRYASSDAGEVLYLAGLWRRDDDGLSVALLDQPALPGFIANGVERMPIALDLDLAFNWITGLPMSRARARQRTDLIASPPA